MISFGSFQDIGKVKADEIWLIVRSLKSFPQANVPVIHVPDLSPSWELFTEFQNKKKAGQWNKDTFENWYKPIFLNEMKSIPAMTQLARLYTEGFKKDILCICFCPDESTCHRSIIRELLLYRSPETFYCLVAGSRTFNDYDLMCKSLDYQLWNKRGNVVIVSGGAKGADALAERYAKERGYGLKVFPADWSIGKSAGYRRNEQMHRYISQFQQRGCVCFWDGQSHGTAHNFELCKSFGTNLRVFRF